ncbi:D-alanine--D-alanine ligase [bacterium]|nr:MAG: D-alanine--D-alanine ligase [bacterium]
MRHKKRVLVLFGGKSAEHKVSIQSASSIISALNKKKYDIIPVAINQFGKWLNIEDSKKLLPALIRKEIITKELVRKNECIDVVFPVLHGHYGEDGAMQGMLEILNVPYVGAGVLPSAIGMDKGIQKIIFEKSGILIVPWLSFKKEKWEKEKKNLIEKIEKKLSYPIFVKPINLGSSIGISRARNHEELTKGISLAFYYSREVIIEQGIDAREIECSVLGNDNPKSSVPGEIIASREFYNYEAKYIDNKSELIIPAKLSKIKTKQIQHTAITAFKAIKASGMARVDFLLDKTTKKLYLNEINTIPGFTKISMYPKLWQASGVGYSELLDQLINLAFNKYYGEEGKSAQKPTLKLCDIGKR